MSSGISVWLLEIDWERRVVDSLAPLPIGSERSHSGAIAREAVRNRVFSRRWSKSGPSPATQADSQISGSAAQNRLLGSGFGSRRPDGQGRPLGFILAGGEASDYNAVPGRLAIPVGKPRLFLADKGYDGDFLREELLTHGISPVIPPKANRKNPPVCDIRVYKDRNRIERLFNRLKQFSCVATRYDKTRTSFSAFFALAAAKIWLPYFVNSA